MYSSSYEGFRQREGSAQPLAAELESWYHNFELDLEAAKPVELRVEWEPNNGYISLEHADPLPQEDRHSVSFASEAGKAIDYYVVPGADMDALVAGYRRLTGKASMMPRWAYGFWQSRQRYETQDALVGVLEQYREANIPIDNIVQDWFYWPEDQWGSHTFDPARFPDPQAMVDAVHALDGRIMISVWPKFYPDTANGQELAAKGFLYPRPLEAGQRDWVGPGYANTFYDPSTPEARAIYFRQMRDGLVSKGFDAWWMDATEPDWHSNLSVEERALQMTSPSTGVPGAAIFNSYPLVHAEGVTEGLRAAQPDRRPFILTRSGFGGIQRASAALWSGDVAARWDDLRDQISAGANLSLSGVPNWTHDIGGFALEERFSKELPEALPEWRELYLRWFQFGAFSPLFRSHGEYPFRETPIIARDDPAMMEGLTYYHRLRYRLLPYIYTLAAGTYFDDGDDHAPAGDGLRRRPPRVGHRRRIPVRPRAARRPGQPVRSARANALPARRQPTGSRPRPASAIRAGSRSPLPRRASASRCSPAPARSSRSAPRCNGPARTRRVRLRSTCSPAPTARSRSTRTRARTWATRAASPRASR